MPAAAAAALVVVVFGWSAATKLADPSAFRRSLPATLGVAPLRARRLAPVVVAAEVLVVLAGLAGLVSAPVAVLGLLAAAGLLAVFTAALASMLRRGVVEPCRCFGARSAPPGPVDLARNGLLVALCLGGVVAVLAGGPAVAAGPLAAAAGAVVGAVVALLVVHLDELVWLFGPVRPEAG
jgi:hypothetical protein